MKIITIHWTEMRTIEVPETCPTDSISTMFDWIAVQDNDGFDLENYSIDRDSRDYEIVDVTTTNNKRSNNEKRYYEKTGGTGSFSRDQ